MQQHHTVLLLGSHDILRQGISFRRMPQYAQPCDWQQPLRKHDSWLQAWDEWGYLLCGLFTVTPLLLYPIIRPGEADKGKALNERFWVKANVWHAVFGFVGNYFWTHYFFQLLGAAYTMPSHRLNQVSPLAETEQHFLAPNDYRQMLSWPLVHSFECAPISSWWHVCMIFEYAFAGGYIVNCHPPFCWP
jgi:hypothetical protein